jgi:transcriptional regulator with XRE-family HTH domain
MTVEETIAFIKHERTRKAISLRDLGKKCDVRAATISEIENGKSKGEFDTIVKLLNGLGYDFEPVKQKI